MNRLIDFSLNKVLERLAGVQLLRHETRSAMSFSRRKVM
jgi:hypothetical protein